MRKERLDEDFKKRCPVSLRGGSECVTVALIDSPHTFPEVTSPWERASSLMTGENIEEAPFSGLSGAVNYLRRGLWLCSAMATINLLLTQQLVFVCVGF